MNIQQFDFSVDLLQTLLWQYNKAQRLQSLLEDKQAWYLTNQSDFWQDWFDDIFNLETATDFGLAMWSQILDIPLFADVNPTPAGEVIFGFASDDANFENGQFGQAFSSTQQLTVQQKLLVLSLRYFQLITRGAATEVTAFLNYIFKNEGGIAVADGLNMNVFYQFRFAPSSDLLFVLQNFDVLPRPAGVGIFFSTVVPPSFGFGDEDPNFENGNFGA